MYEDEIKRGMAWLEEIRPGSLATINLDRLDLSSPEDCPLGQIFAWDAVDSGSGYAWATRMHSMLRNPRPDDCCGACRYGFCCPDANGFPALTEEWKEALQAREEDQRKAELRRVVLRSNHEMPGRWTS